MSLLDSASLICTPNGYKEGKLYSVIPSDGSGDLSVTRATTATRVNSAGLVELVPYNLLQYSQDFSNAAWDKLGVTITSGQAGYDGTNNAFLINVTSTFPRLQQSISNTGLQTLSVYAKAASYNYLFINSLQNGVGANASFDLVSGTQIVFFPTQISSSITSVGNGWWKIVLTFSPTTFGSIAFGTSLNGTINDWATATAGSVFIQDAQINEGTLKDYQKTETRLNIPRLDYSNGTCPSLLVEPQRTNLALWSSSFDNAYWTQNATVTANSTISPSGVQDADTLTDASNSYLDVRRSFTISASTAYTFSIFVKKTTGTLTNYPGAGFSANGGAGIGYAIFNTTTGAVNLTDVAGDFSISAKSTSYGDYYRFEMTFTTGQTSLVVLMYPALSTNGTTLNSNAQGSNVFWGAQLEAGSYPTSLIPTQGSTVTRNADGNLTLMTPQTLNDFVLFYDGLFFDENVAMTFGSGGNNAWYAAITASINRIVIDLASGRKYEAFNGNLVINQRIKIAIKRASGVFDIFVNGVKLTAGIQITDTTALSLVSVGWSFSSTFYTQGRINSAAAWQTSLTDAQCQTLTTI